MVDHTRGGGPSEPPKTAPNRLCTQSSPYLLQHCDDPVDWHPWGDEALALARAADKPILLSIGYSSCQITQLMGRESFADPVIAKAMNDHFVCVMVDRDERPDIDKVYQLTHQLIQRSGGGWPLTAFLDPSNQIPFFTGTYFPKRATTQLPGLRELLTHIHELFVSKRQELVEQGDQIRQALTALSSQPEHDPNDPIASTLATEYSELASRARDSLIEQGDPNHGGFGRAPKFHFAHALHFLLERWGYSDKADRAGFDTVMTGLTQMARGGMYDQIGGGFFHCSTDRQWMIPQFEKKLYDNGALLRVYAAALQIGPDQLFEDALRDTVSWLERDMQHPEGAFYAAQGGQLPDGEGAHYVWRKPDIKKILTDDEYLLAETLFGLDKPANFEGRWNLHRRESFRSATQRIYLDSDNPRALLADVKAKLLAIREQRPPPSLDHKILAGWNGLAIDGLARSGRQLGEPHWIQLAQQSMDFIREELMENDRLHTCWVKGQLGPCGYLDDYAFCLRALISLLQAQWREVDIRFAITLADLAIELFQATNGGFYFASTEGEKLIHQPQPSLDDTTESGNAALGCALFDLGQLLARDKYTNAAHAILRWAQPLVGKYPPGHGTMLELANRTNPRNQQIILRGAIDSRWLSSIHSGYTPWLRVYQIDYEGMDTLPDYLPRMVSAEMRTSPTAYLCTTDGCSAPIRSLAALEEALATI